MKKILTLGVLLAMIGGAIGYYMYTKPLDSMESMETNLRITAEAFFAAFDNDETLANKLYLDKVVEVSGKVSKVENANNKTSIYLSTEEEMSSIIFQLEKSDPSIKVGDSVTLKGLCTGYLMDVVLVRGVKV